MMKNEIGRTCGTYGGRRGAYRVLVEKPDGRRSLGRPRRWREDKFQWIFKKKDMVIDWIVMIQYKCMDGKLRWKAQVKKKCDELRLKYKKMYWLTGRRSVLSINNKLILYKQILKPVCVWTYGIQLWRCTKQSKIDIIERFQNKVQ